MLQKTYLVFCMALLTQILFAQTTEDMVTIKGGSYIPLYGRDSTLVKVSDFLMDKLPVTNEQYVAFVKEYPEWQKSKAKKLFIDGTYLRNWKNDTMLNDTEKPKSPITYVSWFAASNYCKCQGKRLPTVDEWEYVAMSDEELADARVKETYNQKILSWYEAPRTNTYEVGRNSENYWGVKDLHGLVWEWTSDFNSILITGESRKDVDKDSNLFCGSAAIGATDLMNYAAFMRYAFRGSISARYSIKNLGFRCVKDVPLP
ncbi:formylglycine-generating enzyme family protein [Formosa sp. PL04]|uniref:formylglycine-generating enzyme family protein n=1 Tax=Formosa sp. PL04 TaxID=3081755 RepID=UPI002981625D|nr:formylglycine-generating enzyme family protein [Formosa sp. PL04]MDW5290669.1 formylglycine-generating enzyme family protein [Formosa sp. PL04]